jgi:uncharacterized protein
VILCDTSALIALVNNKDKNHTAVKVYEHETLVISTTVLCEVDYFLTKYLGEHIAKAFFENVTQNEQLLFFDSIDLNRVNEIRRSYNDLPLGFVDASLIALAERYKIRRILTLDRRHFTAVKPHALEYLELLP